MLETPEILDLPARPIACIRMEIPSREIMQHMMPALHEIRQALADQGLKPAGQWLTHHYKIPDATFDFEVCVPVDSAITPQGRVTASALPAARVVRTVYCGDYAGLPHGWGDFMQWIKAQSLTTAGDFWEVYAVGPDDSHDPAQWRTELNCPLS